MPALTLAPCSIVTDNIGWTCFVRLVAEQGNNSDQQSYQFLNQFPSTLCYRLSYVRMESEIGRIISKFTINIEETQSRPVTLVTFYNHLVAAWLY